MRVSSPQLPNPKVPVKLTPFIVLPLLLIACAEDPKGTGDGTFTYDTGTDTTPTTSTTTATTTANSLPELVLCTGAAVPTAGSGQSWENFTNEIVALTEAGHSAQDVLTTDLVPATLSAKFAYGLISKDLQGEWVEVWVDDCSGDYRLLGEWLTDGDGRVNPEIQPGALPDFGRYNLFFRVKGDQTTTQSSITILPQTTQLLVFDIDGTLTTSDTELFNDVLNDYLPFLGDFVPEARPWSGDLAQLRADQGYVFVYLTGRPYWLTDISREWLVDLGYPVGTLHLTETNGESVPTDDAVGVYKAAYLNSLIDLGFTFSGAYGNATTDIYAYDQAGIAKDRTWISGDNGGVDYTVDIGESYEIHYAAAVLEADPVQPFLIP